MSRTRPVSCSRLQLGLSRVVLHRLAILLATAVLISFASAQQSSEGASLSGNVRDSQGAPIPDAAIHLESKDPGKTLTVRTNAQGKYRFAGLNEGVYVLRTEATGYAEAKISSVFFGQKEALTVDLTLRAESGPGNSQTAQPQFYDEPQFTVAGVTDTTNLGGHGSDVIVRTRDKLAKDTATLGDVPKVSSSPSPEELAEERSLRERAETDPSNFEANHRLGELLLHSGRARKSLPYLDRAAKLKPGDYQNTYDQALANAEAGNYDRARSSVQRLIASHDRAELHHLLGDIEEKLGDPLEAVRQYQRAAELDPRESYVFDWGSELLLHHAPEPALEVFTKGNHLFPRSERMLMGLGAASFARGSYDEAVRHICEASELNPNDPAPYQFLGKMQRAESSTSSQAVETLHRFVTLQPGSAEANYYYALAFWKSRKDPKEKSAPDVESFLNKAVSLDPRFAAAELQLGILDSERGNYTAAASSYERALKLDPQMEEAHYRLAQAYRQLGKADLAKEELQLYYQCVKDSAERVERERHEIRQFVYTMRDPPPVEAR